MIKHLTLNPQTDKRIVIIGMPCTGKTTITEQVIELLPDHDVIHTDDYIKHGFENALYKMISDIMIKGPDTPIIVEGVQGYRLLRKGLQTGDFLPDVVITVSCDDSLRLKRMMSRDRKAIDTGFDKTLGKIHMDYLNNLNVMHTHTANFKMPRFITIDTNEPF